MADHTGLVSYGKQSNNVYLFLFQVENQIRLEDATLWVNCGGAVYIDITCKSANKYA